MDILSPELVWISGRCYRINEEHSSETIGADIQEETDAYDTCSYDINDEDDLDYEIEEIQNGRFKTSFHIPQFYYPQIIGSKGAIKKRIEIETKTQIRVPRQGQEGLVTITATTAKNVIAARRRIDLIVIASRGKQAFTHFLSIPFNTDDIKKRFREFKSIIQDSCNGSYSDSLFQIPEKLHLTLGTMCLMDNDDRTLAAELLIDCKRRIIDPVIKEKGPFKLLLSGIEYMNDDPSAVDVLYGQVHGGGLWADEDLFQNMVDQIVECFVKKGLMLKQYESVKLHVTLMNSLFCTEDNECRKNFDARSILKSFEFFDFGSQILQEIHLSQRYSTGCNGYYEATAIVNCC